MKGFALNEFDAAPALRDDLPVPVPGTGEVLVRVHASSVNPVDSAIAAGMLRGMAEYHFPVILGRDYAGVVEEVGGGVTRYEAGDEVYGFLLHASPAVHDGSWAELIVTPEGSCIAPAPKGVDPETAAAAPLAGISAMLALDALELAAGDTVLIVGATGGVGSLAVQLASAAGATVIAPGLPVDEDYLRGLGVSELVPRGAGVAAAVLEQHPDGVDAVLDLVSYAPDAVAAFAQALRPGGVTASSNGAAGDGPGRTNVMAAPTTENLERLARLLESGALRVPIQRSYPLAQAGDAFRSLSSDHTQGKLTLTIA